MISTDTSGRTGSVIVVVLAPAVLLAAFVIHPYIAVLPDAPAVASAVEANTTRWGIAHLLTGVGSALVGLAFLAIRAQLRDAGEERFSRRGLPLVVFGSALYAFFPGLEFAPLSAQIDRISTPYTPPTAYQRRGQDLGPMGVFAPEYGLIDKVNVFRGLFDSFAILYPRVQGDVDLRAAAPALEVPVYVIEGEHEHPARYDLAVEWVDGLDAPSKRLFVVDSAGHPAVFERFDETQRILTTIVLPETHPNG